MTNDDGGTPWFDAPIWASEICADHERALEGEDRPANGPARGLADAPADASAAASGRSKSGGDGGSTGSGRGNDDISNDHISNDHISNDHNANANISNDGGGAAPMPAPAAGPCELLGIELRSFLVLQMRAAGGPVRVADLVDALDAGGFAVAGRTSKVISDALRWEVARGRVRRLGRGLYCQVGRIPRSTLRRMRARVAESATRSHVPVRAQPLRSPRPLVSPEGPWRYHRRYGLGPPRLPKRMLEADHQDRRRCTLTSRRLARSDGGPSH